MRGGWELIQNRAAGILCRLVGHVPQAKMKCTICRRCRVVLRPR